MREAEFNMIRHLSFFGILLVLLGVLSACSPGADGSEPALSAPPYVDFGEVEVGQSSTVAVPVSNLGSTAVEIPLPVVSGDEAAGFSLQDSEWPVAIEVGGTAEVVLHFTPTDSGTWTALLELDGLESGGLSGGGSVNEPENSHIAVTLVGTGLAAGADDDSAGDDDDTSGDDDDSVGDDDDTTGDDDDIAPADADADGYPAVADGGNDCDDGDDAVHPGALELCDGVDSNCNGLVDDDAVDAVTWYLDADGDGYGSANLSLDACVAPAGYVNNTSDCDDLNPSSYPAADELCDGADNDCDTDIDEGVESTFYGDADGDGYGSLAAPQFGCTLPQGTSFNSDDCDDSNPSVSPAALELCDAIDNDCDLSVDEDALDATLWYLDSDGDGAGGSLLTELGCSAPSSYVDNSGDCDDLDPTVGPNAPELCNSADDDCDGQVDEGAPSAPIWYLDNDGDGFGGTWLTQQACAMPFGYAPDSSDCDDTDATALPGGTEICDGADNDCNGAADDGVGVPWYADVDADGYGDPGTTQSACLPPTGYVSNALDCDDGAATTSPASYEVCDGIDNNCTGGIDEGNALDGTDWYIDADADGFGDATGVAISSCVQPAGYTDNDDDCNDDPATGAGVNPSSSELCNQVDDDCDGTADDGAVDAVIWYIDSDGDQYGDANNSQLSCTQPAGTVADATDCDDTDLNTNPGAPDICDSVDNDCDTAIDENAAGTLSLCPALDCQDVLDSSPLAGDGVFWIDPDGSNFGTSPFQVDCLMSVEGGGWTRILLIDPGGAYNHIDGVPNSQEYVNNGSWVFSKTLLKNGNRELMYREIGGAGRLHRYDFAQGSNVQGEDFVGAVTGDLGAEPAVWNFQTSNWQLAGDGQCNNNNHSQWNCVPTSGVRFHHATRDWSNDGGSCATSVCFTGYSTSGNPNPGDLILNWDGNFNTTPHNLYVR